jgi:hypothetical protein
MSILSFIRAHAFLPADIRQSVGHLSWKIQMQCIVDALNNVK